jgi:3-hydroxyisobutyrate dehydrogenase
MLSNQILMRVVKELSNSILVIGAGKMGYGVIKTLLSKGNIVYVSDPSEEAVERVVKLGAIKTRDISEVLPDIEFVFLSLPTPKVVLGTVTNIKNSVHSNEFAVIDLSTIDPQTAIAAHDLLREVGVSYVEAPVSGGPKGAESGTLSIMVGCNNETYAIVSPILEQIGKNIFHLGEVGRAALAKICNNIIVAATATILSEAFILAAAGGIAPEKLRNILENSVGGSRTLDVFGDHLVSGDFSSPTFALALMHKDVGLFMDAIKQYNVTSFIGSTTYQIYNGAFSKEDWKFSDHTVVHKYLQMLNGKEIEGINEESVNDGVKVIQN